jgi:hypothetical protein
MFALLCEMQRHGQEAIFPCIDWAVERSRNVVPCAFRGIGSICAIRGNAGMVEI